MSALEAQLTESQAELPFAVVQGERVTHLPPDLYIPPDALEVFLETFEGPFDLLLYLIKRQHLDILNIPVAEITRQYMQYIELMNELRLELAAEYLVMAAVLAEIKSRMLLPQPDEEPDEEVDPRAELVRRLQEYERYKKAAEDLGEMPQVGQDIFPASAEVTVERVLKSLPEVTLKELLGVLKELLARAKYFSHHHIQREPLSVRERMSQILDRLQGGGFIGFTNLFSAEEGSRGVIVVLLAILELVKESLIELVQAEPFGPIHVQARAT
jgi:Uncharacterized conserved protein